MSTRVASPPRIHEDDNSDGSDDDSYRVAWARECKHAMLDFYGLDDLFPRKWSDGELHVESVLVDQKELSMGKASAIQITRIQSNINAPEALADQMLSDTADPLGVKSSGVVKNRRRSAVRKDDTTSSPSMNNLSSVNPQTVITNKKFEPRLFLKEVHRHTSFRDIEKGYFHLQMAVEQRTELMKALVKTNFAKFVSSKSTIDSFYKEMKSRNLSADEEYGIKNYRVQLDDTCKAADELFAPIMSRRNKAQKLRATLGVLEQWKFFFNLPYTLQEFIRKGKYDAAVRDYKKGRYLMTTSFGDAVVSGSPTLTVPTSNHGGSSGATNSNNSGTILPKHHQATFEKVWKEVENDIQVLRTKLYKQLSDFSLPMDIQEKALGYLVELDGSQDPIWFYLDSQFKHIIQLLVEAYDAFVRHLQNVKSMAATNDFGSTQQGFNLHDFRLACSLIQTNNYGLLHEKSKDVGVWKALLKLVQNVTNVMRTKLPEFWKLSKNFIDEKYQQQQQQSTSNQQSFGMGPTKGLSEHRASAAPPRRRGQRVGQFDIQKVQQCHEMVGAIFGTFASILAMASYMERPKPVPIVTTASGPVQAAMASASTPRTSNVSSPLGVTQNVTVSITPGTPQVTSPGSMNNTIPTITTSSPQTTMHPGSSTVNSAAATPTSLTASFDAYKTNFPPVELASFMHAHPLTVCYYMSQIMSSLSVCFEDIKSLRISFEHATLPTVANIIEDWKAKTLDILLKQIVAEAKAFRKFEDWTFYSDRYQSLSRLEPTNMAAAASQAQKTDNSTSNLTKNTSKLPTKPDITNYMKLFSLFFKYSFSSVRKIVLPTFIVANVGSGLDDDPIDIRSSFESMNGNDNGGIKISQFSLNAASHLSLANSNMKLNAVGAVKPKDRQNMLMDNVRESFLETLYSFMTGLRLLVSEYQVGDYYGTLNNSANETVDSNGSTSLATRALSNPASNGLSVGGLIGAVNGGTKHVSIDDGLHEVWLRFDVSRLDSRLLTVLSNATYFKQVMVPKFLMFYEDMFRSELLLDGPVLKSTAEYLDTMLLSNYVKRKMAKIAMLIRNGILCSGLNWSTVSRISEIRPFVYEILLDLVLIHAEVREVSKHLIHRIMSQICFFLAQELLFAIRRIDKFNFVGMLQAHMEVQFLQDTLSAYETAQVKTVFQCITETLEKTSGYSMSSGSFGTSMGTGRGVSVGAGDDATGATPSVANQTEMLKAYREILDSAKNASSVLVHCFVPEI